MLLRYLAVFLTLLLVVLLLVYTAVDAESLPRPTHSLPHSQADGAVDPPKNQVPSYADLHCEIDLYLRRGQRNLVQWAVELIDKEPKDIRVTLVKIDVMFRMGLDRHAAKAVVHLKPFCDKFVADANTEESSKDDRVRETKQRIQDMVRELYETAREYSAQETAFALVDTFPEVAVGIEDQFYWLMKQLREDGWDDQRIARWLSEKHRHVAETSWVDGDVTFYSKYDVKKKANSSAPLISLGQDRPEIFWLRLRVCQSQRFGQEDKLLVVMEQDAREHPEDTMKMLDYLNVLHSLCYCKYQSTLGGKWDLKAMRERREGLDLAWVAETFQPQRSTAAYAVAEQLCQLRQFTPAAKLYRHALAIPSKENEILIEPESQRWGNTPEREERGYRNRVRLMLARCLTMLDKPREANAAYAAMLRRPTKKGKQESAETVSDSIPKEISFEELERRTIESMRFPNDHPYYWERLASFYRRHKRDSKAEHAYQKGLELAKPGPPRQGKIAPHARTLLVAGYADLLYRAGRTEEFHKLMLGELRTVPASSESAIKAMELFLRYYRLNLASDEADAAFWKWLEDHSYWGRLESKVLSCLESMNSSKLPEVKRQFMQQVEKLTKNGDPSRAHYYGKLLLRMRSNPNDWTCAIPWCRYAAEYEVPKDSPRCYKQLQRDAKETLFDIYVAGDDIPNAERLHRDCTAFLSVEDWRCQLKCLAVSAAVEGDRKLAMRYWLQSASISLCDQSQRQITSKLRRLGLGDEIDAYYRRVKKKLPGFISLVK